MLNLPERIIFILVALTSLTATTFGVRRLIRIIGVGQGRPDWHLAWKRFGNVLARMMTFQPVFRARFWPSLFHALVGWGFGFYLLVNLFDVIAAFEWGFHIPGWVGDVYRLLADVLTVAVLGGMVFFVIRRFIFRPANLSARQSILLHPKARFGIQRDSAIVAGFILLHIGARFVGDSVSIAYRSMYNALMYDDTWQPFAALLARVWIGVREDARMLLIGEHIAFWLALGTILIFLPYFPYSKHIHLFFAPLNFLLKPERRSMGEMNYINLDNPSVEQFGAAKMAGLGWEQIMDAYACSMCFRCQEVCPAHQTGKVLSPAALEINKRYLLNGTGMQRLPETRLVDFAVPPEAVWACTACGACVDICPVNNEPMRDILDIRRALVMMDNTFPKQLETAFRGMERTGNPWGVSHTERMKWAEGLKVPTIEQNPQPDILWWVGCAPSTDARAQKTARAFARILNAAGVNYAVLGRNERCTGDSARRAGREDIFFGLATANVEILNDVKAKRIVTTCPHCLHTLKNEYPAFGGDYEVIHHTQLIGELMGNGKFELGDHKSGDQENWKITFHDPCYLGRHNQVFDAPRDVLIRAGLNLIEMPRHADKSFCCGAGGAQMWKEEEHGTARVSETRLAEAKATGAAKLVVGCPFCIIMLTDAAKAGGEQVEVLDVGEVLMTRLK